MDLKRTKAIRQPFTKNQSPSTGPASGTVNPSRALKNSSKDKFCKAHALGLRAEERVVEFLLRHHLKILKTRWRTTYAEIDILAESARGEIWILEVKTLSHFDFINVRVSRRQKERLKRAHLFVQSKTKKPVRLALALVDRTGAVKVFTEF